jgi:rRNA-processing protein FCF1
MPSKKAAPKKSDAKPSKTAKAPAKKAVAPAKPEPKPRPAPPKPSYTPPPKAALPPDPEFVKKASFADRKAALEALAEKEGVPATPPIIAGTVKPMPPPTFVREAPAADRKAAMEKVVQEQGVTGILSKAPWKRPGAPAPPPAPTPPVAAEPQRTAPRVQMTKAPLSATTGRSPPQKVILDSNALMMQFQFHIDIEKEVNRLLNGNYQYVVPQIVIDELARLAKEGGSKEATEARMAIELAKTFEVMESPGAGDTGILRLAEKINAIVVTNDKKLRAQLRAKDIPNIYMRSRAFLTIEGHIPGM